jgi:hypothetical protein
MTSGSGGGGIRLRPLGIGDLLDETFRIYRRHFLPFLVAMGVVLVPTIILEQALRLAIAPPLPMPELGAAPGPLPGSPLPSLLVSIGIFIITFVTDTTIDGAATLLAANAILGRPLSVAEAYRQSLRRLGRLLWASFLARLKIFLFAISIVGLYAALRRYLGWALIVPAIMLEDQTASGAPRRSWVLVDKHRRRMLACWVLILLLQLILINGSEYLIQYGLRLLREGTSANFMAPPTVDMNAAIVEALTATLFGAIWPIAKTLFYFDLRVRKDAFDLERAADLARLPGQSKPSSA